MVSCVRDVRPCTRADACTKPFGRGEVRICSVWVHQLKGQFSRYVEKSSANVFSRLHWPQFLHCAAHPPLLANCARYQSHLCLAKSHQIVVAMSLCLKHLISLKKKALTALLFTAITQTIYKPSTLPQYLQTLYKMTALPNLKKILSLIHVLNYLCVSIIWCS